MNKFTGTIGSRITLVGGLITLVASLAALLLFRSLMSLLEEVLSRSQGLQSSLQDLHSKASVNGRPVAQDLTNVLEDLSGVLSHLEGIGSPWFSYLLPFTLGLTVLASLLLVVMSALALRQGSRSSGVRPRPVAVAPEPKPVDQIPTSLSSVDGRWMKLVEECVGVIDELDEDMGSFDAPRREVAEHMTLQLEEILGRSGVEVISNDATFDRARHTPVAGSATSAPGAAISETLSPGFAVGARVLRRARVRLNY